MAENQNARQYSAKRARQIEKAQRVRKVGQIIAKYFPDNPYVVMAMLGNIDVETDGSFDPRQKQYRGGPGRGLFQFDFHKKNYAEYLKRKGLEDDEESQVRYVYDSIYGDEREFLGFGNAKKLRTLFARSKNSIDLSDAFQDIFLRPQEGKEHTPKRREATSMYTMAFIPAQEKPVTDGRIFPGLYPERKNKDGTVSNTLSATVQIDNRHFVIPTMAEGKKMSLDNSITRAKDIGLYRFPSFQSSEDALKYSQSISGKVDEYGFLKSQ
tara:strand:+ start:524 stop:1327 length:804 start_codon:yes stop_codon:yes gene_type:complete